VLGCVHSRIRAGRSPGGSRRRGSRAQVPLHAGGRVHGSGPGRQSVRDPLRHRGSRRRHHARRSPARRTSPRPRSCAGRTSRTSASATSRRPRRSRWRATPRSRRRSPLVDSGRLKLSGDLTTLTLELKVGPIRVDLHADGGEVRLVVMSQKRPLFLRTHEAADVLPAFGLEPDDALPGVPIQTVSTGTPQLMVPVRGLEVLRRLTLDLRRYRALRAAGDFFSRTSSASKAPPRPDARSRGTPAFRPTRRRIRSRGRRPAAWPRTSGDTDWSRRPRSWAEQGHWMGRPGSRDRGGRGAAGTTSRRCVWAAARSR